MESLDKIKILASEVAADLGVEITRISLSGRGRKSILRVFIDREAGVTIKDCEVFSRRLEALLDVEDVIKSSYLLEVSSPGMDRPVSGLKDFQRFCGRLVRIITKDMIENQTFFIGRIIDSGEGWVRILLEDRKVPKYIYIPFEKISKAHLEIEMKQEQQDNVKRA